MADLTIGAGTGAFTLTGIDAAVQAASRLIATGSFTLTGVAVVFKRGHGVAATRGAFTLVGKIIAFKVHLSRLFADAGRFRVFDFAVKFGFFMGSTRAIPKAGERRTLDPALDVTRSDASRLSVFKRRQ